MKNELLSCEYCGGTLTHTKGHVWICDYCGRQAVISNEHDVVKCDLKIEHNNDIHILEMADKCVIVSDYRKRVTMADPLPMYIKISTDEESCVIEPVENIGKGSITLVFDVNRIKSTVDGKINVGYAGPVERNRYLDTGASILLGSVKITISDNA